MTMSDDDRRFTELLSAAAGHALQGDVARARQMLPEVEQAAAPTNDVDSLLAPTGAAELFADLPPINWVCEGLELCPGAPMVMGGYGFSGKTVFAQRLLLSVASGVDFCGLRVRRGVALHIDLEQGRQLTYRRYRRLCQAEGIAPHELDAHLLVSVYPDPRLSLSTQGAEDRMMRVAEGKALIYIDSFLAACPGLKENDANAREPLDMLTRVSEKTDCAFLVSAHANKPLPMGKRQGGERMSLRGSGALYDAAGSCWIASAEKGKPTWLAHEKAKHTGICRADLTMTISDAEDGGLRVDLSERSETDPLPRADAKQSELREKLLKAVREHPGQTTDAVVALAEVNKGAGTAELKAMGARKQVVFKPGAKNATRWFPPASQGGG